MAAPVNIRLGLLLCKNLQRVYPLLFLPIKHQSADVRELHIMASFFLGNTFFIQQSFSRRQFYTSSTITELTFHSTLISKTSIFLKHFQSI
jgi:hypothetical protein